MEKMKRITKNLIDNSKAGDAPENCVASIRLENDQGYFSTYSHFGIHHEMLSVSIEYCIFDNYSFTRSSWRQEK